MTTSRKGHIAGRGTACQPDHGAATVADGSNTIEYSGKPNQRYVATVLHQHQQGVAQEGTHQPGAIEVVLDNIQWAINRQAW